MDGKTKKSSVSKKIILLMFAIAVSGIANYSDVLAVENTTEKKASSFWKDSDTAFHFRSYALDPVAGPIHHDLFTRPDHRPSRGRSDIRLERRHDRGDRRWWSDPVSGGRVGGDAEGFRKAKLTNPRFGSSTVTPVTPLPYPSSIIPSLVWRRESFIPN